MAQLKDLLVTGDARVIGNLYSNNPVIAYGTCTTAAATAEKAVTIDNPTWALIPGAIVNIKFSNTNTASNPTLKINNYAAKSVSYNGSIITTSNLNKSGHNTLVETYVYDGTNYIWLGWSADTNDNTYTSALCITAADTAAKTATMTYYTATANTYVYINFKYTNTATSALTLNINSQGNKPIYINGTASSSTNYTLPAGSYIAYYDGTNYYLRTDGKLTASITGDAATVGGETITNYVKKTDYADSSVGGVIKTGSGTQMGSDGVLKAVTYTYSEYPNKNNNSFIGKGTLENVITGKGLLVPNDITITPVQQSGATVGTIKVGNGSAITLYAPQPGAVSTNLVTANQTYYVTGVKETVATEGSQIYNTRMSNTFTGLKYQTSTSSAGGSLFVDDREVTLGLYYNIE